MPKKGTTTKKVLRILALVAVVVLLLLLVIFNALRRPDNTEKVWDGRTTLGAMDARNYYIMYTDVMCPYCNIFSRALLENEEAFKQDYIEGEDILFEVRPTEFLYEFSEYHPDGSRWGAEALYCARNEDKFWDYYHAALTSLWDDYYSKGVGDSKTSPEITDMTEDYWIKIGERAGVGGNFDSCMKNHETLEEIVANTEKAAGVVNGGMPYFQFNKFTTSGFDPSWGWDGVKEYLDAGLKQK